MVTVNAVLAFYLARKQQGAFREYLVQASKRIKMMSEVLVGIRSIKYYSWEQAFLSCVQKLRVLELRKLLKYQCYQLPANTLGSLSPVCMPIIVFYVYIRQGNNITYIQTFTTLMVFEKVLSALKELPQTLNSIVEALESLKRIRAFLTSSSLQQYVETRPSPEGDENERDIIVIKGAHLGWKDAREC